MALHQTDDYITEKGAAIDTINRIRLYASSMARYGKSPYIYPLYGLGELPQGFARLSAIYGGTYMLNTNVEEIMYEGSKACGIRATMKERGDEGEGMKFTTKAKKIVGDPSYFQGKVQVTGHVLRAICILTHPVPNTDNSDSAQIIIPQSQVGRKNGESLMSQIISGPCADNMQISTSPWCPPRTTSALRATTSPSFPRSPRRKLITIWSYNRASSGWARSKRSSWARPFRSSSHSKAVSMITSSSRRATTPPVTLRLRPVGRNPSAYERSRQLTSCSR